MKLRQVSWKWLLLGLVALLLAGLAVLPRFFVDSTQLANRLSATLAAWTGGDVKLAGPLRMQFFPDVALRGGFELTNAKRLPLVKSIATSDARVSLDLGALLLGRIRINAVRLVGPEITLKDAPSLVTGPDQTLQARVANLLDGAPLRVLRVLGGTVRMSTTTGTESIEQIDARFELGSGTGALSSSGSFRLRDEAVSFTLESGACSQTADSVTIPVTLSLTATPLTATVTGNASFREGFALEGDLQADTADARALLRWAGIPLAEGESLKKLSASGQAHWNGTTLIFDDGSFTIDGNTAVGALAITPGMRPRIDGTLAFDRLVLDPYVRASLPTNSGATHALSDRHILKAFDTDLRISAAEITAPTVTLGRGGFTISAREGFVSSEVGELEFCGGTATGRIDADLSQVMTKAAITGKLADIPIEDCLGPFGLQIPLSAVGTLRAEFAAEGRDLGALAQGLKGPFKIKAKKGSVSVDFARFFAGPDPLEGDGWSSSATAFQDLIAECRLGDGHIWCERFNMQTANGLISGSGDVDLGQQTLDWRLFVADRATPLQASRLSAETPPQISISGALTRPMIRRADRPTLGDGSQPANTKATQVSPR